jgi:hypothetical protein
VVRRRGLFVLCRYRVRRVVASARRDVTRTALRVFIAGPSECGKTRLAWDVWASRFPRRLTFDFAREVRAELNPDAIAVYSYAELREALADCARASRWHIALCLDHADARTIAPKVCRLLAHPTTSEDERTFARSIGGLVVDCYEAHELAPNGMCPPDVRGLVTRGRHEGISVVVATQAPARVDRAFSENAEYLVAFATQEHTVARFWAAKTSPAVAEMIDEQPRYHCALFEKSRRRIYWLDDKRRVRRVTDYKGRTLSAATHSGAGVSAGDSGRGDTAAE